MLTIKSEKIMDNLLENIEELIDDIERDHAITKTEILESLYKLKEEIEQILMEAGAYGLRSEVDHYARRLLEKNPLSSKVDAYVKSYHEIIKD